MNYLKIINGFLIFIAGFLSCLLIGMFYAGVELPLSMGYGLGNNSSLETPGNWIDENQIHIYENAIVIDLNKASISKYAATGSMTPVLDFESNGIRIVPENERDIKIGDIITFEQGNDLIIHRVIDIGEDENGLYFITKGDNNNVTDGKIRFSQVKYVTVMIIY